MPALLPWQVLPWQVLPAQPEATTVPVQPLGMPVQFEATATVPWQLAGAPWQPDLCPKPDTSPLDVTAIMRTIVYICKPPEIRLSRIRCEKKTARSAPSLSCGTSTRIHPVRVIPGELAPVGMRWFL